MDSSSLIGYKNGFRKAANSAASRALAPLETLLTRQARSERCHVCFILGPPRSGTTLLYELLATQFRCAYFSNLSKRLYRVPVAATRLNRRAIRARRGSFDSVYGSLTGPAAPSEAGRIWRFWMPYSPPYNRQENGLAPAEMQAKLRGMCRVAGPPMLVKYLQLQSEIPRLVEYFPEALFLHLERDWPSNVRSILRGRAARPAGGETGWWSTHPRGWERFAGASSVEQSCAQVVLSHAEIQENLNESADRSRYLRIDYEALCRSPDDILAKIEALFVENAVPAQREGTVNASFTSSSQAIFDTETEAAIAESLCNLSSSGKRQ